MYRIFCAILALCPLVPVAADTEPNDTWQNAEVLPVDTSVAGAQGDNDWYVINITSSLTVTRILIDLSFSHADGNIDVRVYGDDFVISDPNGPVPGLFRTFSTGTSDHEFIDANVVPASPETYYILVSGENLGNSYTLTWTELTGTDDNFEENDSRSSSAPSAEGTVVFGAQSDDDWYSISVRPGNRHVQGSLRYVTHAPALGIDLNMDLTDASGTVLVSSVNLAAGNESIDHIVPTEGSYHLKVYGDNRGDGYAFNWVGLNEAPQAIANTVSTTENTPYHFTVGDFTFSDKEGDNLASATLTRLSLGGGELTHSSGTPVNNADTLSAGQLNTLVYTPPAGSAASPLAGFDFAVNDADTATVSAKMSINVTAAGTTTPVVSKSSVIGAIAPIWLAILVLAAVLTRRMRG